ncbi:MAG TPA: Uma2 family endonuclease, partial [Pyrinomonadaceae bacterium]|nr:Uma2 family endonuclease [Pyrinomonadaceae bacterium]
EARLDPTHRNTADLVVEVISPSSAIYDRNTKAETYGALEVKELWLVDETGETIEVRYQTGQGFDEGRVFKQGEQVVSGIFPDLQLSVEQLFAD